MVTGQASPDRRLIVKPKTKKEEKKNDIPRN